MDGRGDALFFILKPMNKIITFYGPQQSGKSTAADAVAMWAGWTKLSFAQPLYDMVSVILDVDARKVSKNSPFGPLCGKTLREALQLLGTEFGRNLIGEDVWLRHMRWRIEKAPGNVVIDDLRFRNEYEMLRARGGLNATIIAVSRPENEDAAPDIHASEQDWDSFEPDFSLVNDFNYVVDWKSCVRTALKHLL